MKHENTENCTWHSQATIATSKQKSCPAGISNNALMLQVEITTETLIVFARAVNISISFL